MLAIETLYLGPTNHRGPRIKARVMESTETRSRTIEYDDALNSEENHRAAARALIVLQGWTQANGYGPWVVGASIRGYVFVCDTKHGGDRMVV